MAATPESRNVLTTSRASTCIPSMVGRVLRVHNGRTFSPLHVKPEMVGKKLGEFVFTRKEVKHSNPKRSNTVITKRIAKK